MSEVVAAVSESSTPVTPRGMELVRRVLGSRVYDVAQQTPLQLAPQLSARLDSRVYLKREDAHMVFSFKVRGAYNRMSQLSKAQKAQGVICASAGNHAQGVAYSAQKLGVRAIIVMPATTPEIKVRACRERGAEVVLFGDSFSDAETRAYTLQAERNLVFIHPFDDPDVIAGQATIGLELLSQLGEDDYTVFVPVGGGGLIAGIAGFLKAIKPNVKIVGVEPDDSDAMARSVQAGERVWLDQVGLFADGVAVKQVGVHTLALAREYVDDWVTVSTDEICAAIKDTFDDTRAVVEPAGAVGVAGLKKYARQHALQGHTLVAICSGANLNFDRLRHVAERAEIGEQREAIVAVTIPERPGAFLRLCEVLGTRLVTEFNYRYAPTDQARIFLGVQLAARQQRPELIATLEAAGYPVTDLTEDEMAKVHVRHMVGGRAPEAQEERLYAFEFPERPGALYDFLQHLGGRWNISLFHYRNHGSAHGRVLAGFQVPQADLLDFAEFLESTGYPAQDMSLNAAYQQFLQ